LETETAVIKELKTRSSCNEIKTTNENTNRNKGRNSLLDNETTKIRNSTFNNEEEFKTRECQNNIIDMIQWKGKSLEEDDSIQQINSDSECNVNYKKIEKRNSKQPTEVTKAEKKNKIIKKEDSEFISKTAEKVNPRDHQKRQSKIVNAFPDKIKVNKPNESSHEVSVNQTFKILLIS